jgi:hypothetical protein
LTEVRIANVSGTARKAAGAPNRITQDITETNAMAGGNDVASDWMTGIMKLPSMK